MDPVDFTSFYFWVKVTICIICRYSYFSFHWNICSRYGLQFGFLTVIWGRKGEMMSQDDITTLNIYVHYKLSETIKIINWYCKHIFIIIILMVEFMHISFIQRFIWKNGLSTLGGFNLFLVLHEIHPYCVNIYWGYLCIFWKSYYGRKYYNKPNHGRSFIFIHQRTYNIHTYKDIPHMYICTG